MNESSKIGRCLTYNWLDLKSLGCWPTLYAQKLPERCLAHFIFIFFPRTFCNSINLWQPMPLQGLGRVPLSAWWRPLMSSSFSRWRAYTTTIFQFSMTWRKNNSQYSLIKSAWTHNIINLRCLRQIMSHQHWNVQLSLSIATTQWRTN